MALCSSCSAPLPVDTCRCSYCGTRNDMDFAAVDRYTVDRQPSRRQCPDCALTLQTVRVDTGAGLFAIERCERCYGLFFDVGEVQAFLEASVSPAFTINRHELIAINADRVTSGRPVRYIKCPVCAVLMNRVSYAAMSGVVVDQCKEHGIWLDNGELVHLMEWQKAGGQLLEQKKRLASPGRSQEYPRPEVSFPGGMSPETGVGTDLVVSTCLALFKTLFG